MIFTEEWLRQYVNPALGTDERVLIVTAPSAEAVGEVRNSTSNSLRMLEKKLRDPRGSGAFFSLSLRRIRRS